MSVKYTQHVPMPSRTCKGCLQDTESTAKWSCEKRPLDPFHTSLGYPCPGSGRLYDIQRTLLFSLGSGSDITETKQANESACEKNDTPAQGRTEKSGNAALCVCYKATKQLSGMHKYLFCTICCTGVHNMIIRSQKIRIWPGPV